MPFHISVLGTLPRKTCHLRNLKTTTISLLMRSKRNECVYTYPSLDLNICEVEISECLFQKGTKVPLQMHDVEAG